uniref:Uncharacterized protein n=1 Tax=Manihot esculenta TaxID=3983 RepID=A0A2C9VB62_MANES
MLAPIAVACLPVIAIDSLLLRRRNSSSSPLGLSIVPQPSMSNRDLIWGFSEMSPLHPIAGDIC